MNGIIWEYMNLWGPDRGFEEQLFEELGDFNYVFYKLLETKQTEKAVKWLKAEQGNSRCPMGTKEALTIVKELQQLEGPDLCRALGGRVIVDGETKPHNPEYFTTFTTDPDWYFQDDEVRDEVARCLYSWKYGTRPEGKPSEAWLRDADEFLSQAKACESVMHQIFSLHATA